MTAKLSIDEFHAALLYERKQVESLKAEIVKMTDRAVRRDARINNLEQQNRWQKTKLERMEGFSNKDINPSNFKNCDEYVVTQEVFNNISSKDDAKEIAFILLKLFPNSRFFQVVRNQPLKSIYTILQGMKTEQGFKAVIDKLSQSPKKIIEEE